jgi:NAD(P)-dependent dehydrogenase (short-subunit alcohol dehydrogenase family)
MCEEGLLSRDTNFFLTSLDTHAHTHTHAQPNIILIVPMELYQKQMDVNYYGFIRVTQQCLPLIRNTLAKHKGAVQGRMIFTGTGGGPSTAACVPLLSAYLSSKFAGEAFAQVLKTEVKFLGLPIEVSVINPGFVRPTRLQAVGEKLMAQMWQQCEQQHGSTIAKDEYGPLLDHFVKVRMLMLRYF